MDLKTIAQRTPGFTGADLENVLNEAAIMAARSNKTKTNIADCLEAIEKVMLGPARKGKIIRDKEKKITAYHEAGHAVIAHFLPSADPVHKVSIISRGRAAGYTIKLPETDKMFHTREEFKADLAVSMGGYVAEIKFIGDVTTGPSNDLEKATELARDYVMRYGMSEKLGARTYGRKRDTIFLGKEMHEARNYSDETASMIDKEISNLTSNAYKIAEGVISEHKEDIEKMVTKLLKEETLEKEQIVELWGPNITNQE